MTKDGGESSRPTVLDQAYCLEEFRRAADAWNHHVSGHLQRTMSAAVPVLDQFDPETLVQHAEELLTDGTSAQTSAALQTRFADLLATMLAHGQNLHHPRYIGHQVPASVPVAGLFDAVGSMTNQPMAIFEMGPWATAVEHALIRKLCQKVGWAPATSGGILTSGGSLANLTALLTARNVAFPDSWEMGVPRSARLIAHADAHYCVQRSAGMLGLGTRQVIDAKLDQNRRIDVKELETAITASKRRGEQVMAVVACACATPIGAFDPLVDIADICQQHGVWFHVDAAHGGGVLMSRRHRHLLSGLERADSVVWDAHKMMFVPALCAAVLYRDQDHRFAAFQQEAPYLFNSDDTGVAEYDSGINTLECTKRSLGFGLWGLWSMFGESIFEQMVDRTFEIAAYLHQSLVAANDFQPLHHPDGNIVVFQHTPVQLQAASPQRRSEFQERLRSAIVQSGEFYIVQTKLEERSALRVTVMNPRTSESEIDGLLSSLRKFGQRLLA